MSRTAAVVTNKYQRLNDSAAASNCSSSFDVRYPMCNFFWMISLANTYESCGHGGIERLSMFDFGSPLLL